MQKKTQNLRGGIAAAAVICSLAIFGCTTNHTPGDGQPSTTPPMTPAATPGTSAGTNPPMASAMDLSNKVERSVEAQAIMAAHQRERFLGYINPTGPQPNPPDASQVVPPSQYVTPIATVNPSISSPNGNPVVTSGAGGDGTLNFVAAPATVAPSATGATGALATPTTAALNVTPGQFAAGPTATTGTTTTIPSTAALSPTLSSSNTPSPTRAANSPLTTAGTTAASTATQTSSATTTAPSGTGRLVIPNGTTVASGSVRAVTNATGAITVTNVPVVIKGK